MLTDSDLLSWLREPFDDDKRIPNVETVKVYERHKKSILSSLHDNWYSLNIYIDMYRDRLRDKNGREFLAFMFTRVPNEIYTLLVKLYCIESALRRYHDNKIRHITYEELTFDSSF